MRLLTRSGANSQLTSIVNIIINTKRLPWKTWKKVDSKEKYQITQREARHQVYLSRGEAERGLHMLCIRGMSCLSLFGGILERIEM